MIAEFDNSGKQLAFFWLPSLLIFVSLELGGHKMGDQAKFYLPSKEPLSNTMIKYFDTVKYIFDHVQQDIGFDVKLETVDAQAEFEEDKFVICVQFLTAFPPHIYSNLSLHLSRFLHFSQI